MDVTDILEQIIFALVDDNVAPRIGIGWRDIEKTPEERAVMSVKDIPQIVLVNIQQHNPF